MKIYLFIIVLLVIIYNLWTQSNETCKIYWFHKPGCPACKSMANEWKLVEDALRSSSIKTMRIDISNPKYNKMTINFNIESVPCIVKVFPEGTRCVYTGDRKCNNIVEWAYELSY